MKNIAILVYDLTVEYNIVVVEGILNYLRTKPDVHSIISTINAPHNEEFQYDYQYWTSLEALKSDSIDAVIVVTNSFCHNISIQNLSKELEGLLPKPVISVSNPLDLPTNQYTCVSCEQAYEQIIDHLIKKHKKTKIAFMSAALTHSPESEERERAYRLAMQKYNLPVNEDFIFAGDFTPRSAYDAIKGRFKEGDKIPFDALLCANDYMAAGSVSAFSELKVAIPEDVCIVGFDDAEIASVCSPTLSTISQNVSMTGYKAAELAYNSLSASDGLSGEASLNNPLPKKEVIQLKPMFRQSCGCLNKNQKHEYMDLDGQILECETTAMAELGLFSNGLNDMATLYHILNMTDSVTSINRFFHTVVTNLDVVHIRMLAMCIYDQPVNLSPHDDFEMPDTARLLMMIDEDRQIEENYYSRGGIEFSPKKEILPGGMEDLAQGNYYILPIFLENMNYGYLICKLPSNKYSFYSIFLKVLVNAFVHSYVYTKKEEEHANLAEKNQTLNFQSKTDELTKLFNRRGFYEYGQLLLDAAIAAGKKGSIFFCDLDGLKTINDTWGHEIGDLAIKTEAKVLRAAFRDSDMVGRLSGDEFGVIAPGLPASKVEKIRERFKVINEELSKEAKLPFTLSISIGPVEFNSKNTNLKELLKAADKNLYEEKKIKHALRDAVKK